jgi:hypothetical protein
MNKKRFLIVLVFIPILISSCAQAIHEMKSKSYQSKIRPDPTYLTYPKYRIDHLIRKICIIGNGENKDAISSHLTQLSMKYTSSPIKVVQPGNLESVLKGRIIEFETGLTRDESQALSQMLQIDHVFLFSEKISPRQDYIYGGRCYAQISLKIINTINGEIIFQTIKEWGVYYPDPRPTFSSVSQQPSQNISRVCFHMIAGELMYAFGDTKTGLEPKDTAPPFIVGKVWMNSPAQKAGIQKGDKIIGIDGITVSSFLDYDNFIENIQPKQGSTLKVQIERGGKVLEVDIRYPVIPMYPVEERYKEEKKTGTQI